MMNSLPVKALLVLLFASTLSFAQKKREDKQLSTRVVALSPDEQLKGFRLAPGFTIELVASEKDGIVKPIDISFDDAGNLWTQTARMYPLDPISDIQWGDLLELMDDQSKQAQHPAFQKIADLYKGITRGEDKILKITGLYNSQLRVSEWANGLAIPMSILPYKNGAFVAQGSEIFFLEDRNKDGIADTRTPLFTGFGFTDSHTMTHLLRKGPGGWIHFSQGALNKGQISSYVKKNVNVSFDYSKIGRFSPDGQNLEVLVAGLNNIWGYTLRSDGQWYGSEANDLGYAIVPLEEGTAFPGIGNEKFRPYQPFHPPIHAFRVGGTGLSGLAFSDDEKHGFPAEWRDVGFLANPITNSINCIRFKRKPDGSIETEHLEDLLVSDDDWFRPVNIGFGPDGYLYIADWYNKIVSHNEVPTSHPDRDKKHGRIWRIRHISQPTRAIVNFYEVPTTQLSAYLKSPYIWEKRAAWNQISERPISETKLLIPELLSMMFDQTLSTAARVHVLWSLENLGFFEDEFITHGLQDQDDQIRRETLRYLSGHPDKISRFMVSLQKISKDSNTSIKSQLVNTLSRVADPSPAIVHLLISLCEPNRPENNLGGSYEVKFIRYLVRRALEAYPEQLEVFLRQPVVNDIPHESIRWALQVLPPTQRSKYYFQYSPPFENTDLDEQTFLDLASMASDAKARAILSEMLLNPAKRIMYLNYALQNQAILNTIAFRSLLDVPVSEVLKEGNSSDLRRALEVTTNFNLSLPGEHLGRVAKSTQNEGILNLTIKALNIADKPLSQYYLPIVENASLSWNTRLNALQGVIRLDKKLGRSTALAWLSQMDKVEKRTFTNVLSRFSASAALLVELWYDQKLGLDDFEKMTAERIHSLAVDKNRSIQLVNELRRYEEEHKRQIATRINNFKKVAEDKKGDPVNGKMLFQTCLMCHQVKGEGQTIAPALDGLGYRDTEGLLHALLDPDAAIESGYAVYRVVKKDDSIVEGYLVKKESGGTTLAFMGGAQTFISSSDIKSQQTVTGKSFMPAGLIDNLSEKEISDLLTFIKSLN